MTQKDPAAIAYQQSQEQQTLYWEAFKRRLEAIETAYGVSKSDIAVGLGVSRQSLYNFVNKPQKGIRIDRSSIVHLFDSLRFETLDGLKAGEVFSSSRKKLGIEDLNTWLLEAGYAPKQDGKAAVAGRTLAVDDPQIERVSLRLRSGWIPNEATKNYLVNNILDQVIDQSRLSESYYSERLEYIEESNKQKRREIESNTPRKAREDGYDVLSFSESVLYKDDLPNKEEIQSKYRNALKSLSKAGKNSYVRAELYELYQSVLEHHYLGRSSPVTVGTRDCRFRSLTIHLFERSLYEKRIRNEDKELDRIMRDSSEIAEREIRGLSPVLSGMDENRYSYINDYPLLEAVIRCRLKPYDTSDIATSNSEFTVRYSSNATHVANLLLALKTGLCYPLDITSFFMRATGRTEKSLARVAMTLALPKSTEASAQDEPTEESAGLWLASDTLTGIQNATVDAFVQWLSHRPFPQEKQYIRRYLELCAKIGDIRYSFSQARRALYEYTPAIKSDQNKILRRFIEENVIQAVKDIQQDPTYIEALEDKDFSTHKIRLENLLKSAKILYNRTSLLESEPRDKDKVIVRESNLRAIIDSTYRSDEPYARIIRLYAIASEMNHKFIVGSREFLVGKQWQNDPRYSAIEAIKDAQDYVIRKDGVIDLNAYLSMSDVYGTVGLLSFYFGETQKELDQALVNLIKGAHFALKTRFRRRAAQWLSFASRVCIRQGKLDRAACLFKLVTGITDDAVLEEIETELANSTASDEANISQKSLEEREELNQILADAKDWDDVSWLLARGEHFLKTNRAHEAFASFFTALRIATLLKYFRIIPDCLYNMHRAAIDLLNHSETVETSSLRASYARISGIVKDTSSLLLWALRPEDEEFKEQIEDNPREELHKFVLEYMEKAEDLMSKANQLKDEQAFQKQFDATYQYVAKKSKSLAIDFWDSWRANDAISHPVVQAIEAEKFLSDIRA